MIKRDLVNKDQFTGKEGYLRMADNTAKKLPYAMDNITTPYYRGEVQAMVIENPIHDLLLGNVTGVRPPCEPIVDWDQECSVTTRGKALRDKGGMKPLAVKHTTNLLLINVN